MPGEAAHITLACHNVQAACFLNNHPEYHDWTAVTAFYAALHLIDAVFYRQEGGAHGQTHDEHERALKANKKYENIYRHYRPLASAALIARYLESPRDRVAVGIFSEYMSAEKVHGELLRHRLISVIQSAKKQLSAEVGARLDTAEKELQGLLPPPK